MIAPHVPTHRPGAEVVAVADQGGSTQTQGVPGAVDLVRGHSPSLVLERHHHDESTIAPSPRPQSGSSAALQTSRTALQYTTDRPSGRGWRTFMRVPGADASATTPMVGFTGPLR